MDTEYGTAVVVRKDDFGRNDSIWPDYSWVIDSIYEEISGRISVPPGFEITVWCDYCQERPMVAVGIVYGGAHWLGKWELDCPVGRIVESVLSGIKDLTRWVDT